MGELNVTFRGICSIVLRDDPKRARILMPRNDRPRLARGNERYTIPAYVAYLAIPMDAAPAGLQPDLVCDLPVQHAETFDPDASHPKVEAVTRAERVARIVPEQPKERYAVFFTANHQVVVDAFRKNGTELDYSSDPVAPDQEPHAPETSMFWIPSLADAVPSVPDVPDVSGAMIDTNIVASFTDVGRGVMRPAGLLVDHRWRFLHSQGPFQRPIAQEVLVSAHIAGDTASIALKPYDNGEEKVVKFSTKNEPLVIIGNESLDDILGRNNVQSCAEPAYDYELHYQFLSDRGGARPPVLICKQEDDDHRSPPGAVCGPPKIISASGGM